MERLGAVVRFTAVLALVAACRTAPPGDGVATVVHTEVLPAPGDTVSFFEPHVAVDPADAGRIVVGAQYGDGYNRGGLRFWVWPTEDGGRGGEVVPRRLRRPPTMAADVSLAFGPEGDLFFFGISGDSVRAGVPDAALALAASADGGASFAPRSLVGAAQVFSETSFVVSDKPWIAVDGHVGSPYYGALYLAWTRVAVRLDTTPISITRRLVLSASRDGGRTVGPEVLVAEGGMGAQPGVRPDGTLDVVWTDDAGTRVLHAASTDGGASFSEPVVVAQTADTARVFDLPAMAVDAAGGLLACWAAGHPTEAPGAEIRCSRFRAGSWSAPVSAMAASSGAAFGYPAVAATAGAWWLLGYASDAGGTRVLLSRSTDGRRFAVHDTLAAIPLPLADFCPRPGLPCRRDPGRFAPGDYVGLAAAPLRLAAAYVLPRGGRAGGPAEVWRSVVDVTSGRVR